MNGLLRTLAVDLIFCPFLNGYISNKGLFPNYYCVAIELFQWKRGINVLSTLTFLYRYLHQISQKFLVWKNYGKFFSTLHYLTSPEALAETESALHLPCDCKAMNGCHLQYQFSQDCFHCTEERRKNKSALPGKAKLATFSFLPVEFPPACLFGVSSMKNCKNFEDFILWHSFKRKKTTKLLLLYTISDRKLFSTVGPTLRFCVSECPNLGV